MANLFILADVSYDEKKLTRTMKLFSDFFFYPQRILGIACLIWEFGILINSFKTLPLRINFDFCSTYMQYIGTFHLELKCAFNRTQTFYRAIIRLGNLFTRSFHPFER